MRYGIFVTLLILGLVFDSQAQTDNKITLNEAIDIALKNNYQLKQADNNLNLSKTRVLSEKGDFLPSINTSASGSKSIGRQFNQTTGEFGDLSINSFGSSFSVSVPIFTGFENINSLKSSQFNSESTRLDRQRTRETVIFNAASNYLQVLLDKELLQIARENLEAQQQQLEQIRAQVEVGSRPTVDLYNQESEVASQELEVTNRENALNLSRIRLIRSLQVDPLGEYEFETPEIDENQIIPSDYDLRDLVQTAIENRPDIKSAEANIQSMEHSLKATRSILYPSLSFSASLSSSYNNRTFDPVLDDSGDPILDPGTGQPILDRVPFSDQFFDRNISRRFSLSLSIPIFNNFNRRTSIETQEINYKNARLEMENTELQVVQEVTEAFNDYQSVVKQLESTEKALRAAQRSYETEQQRYEVGASTLIELSSANAQYVQAQSDRARAIYNFVFQEKLLDYYIGKLNESIEINSMQQ